MAKLEPLHAKTEDPAETEAKDTIRKLMEKLDSDQPKIGNVEIPIQAVPKLRALLFAPSTNAVSTIADFRKNAVEIIRDAQAIAAQQPAMPDNAHSITLSDQIHTSKPRNLPQGLTGTTKVTDEVRKKFPKRAEFVTHFQDFVREYQITPQEIQVAAPPSNLREGGHLNIAGVIGRLATQLDYGISSNPISIKTLSSLANSIRNTGKIEPGVFFENLQKAMDAREKVGGKIRAKIREDSKNALAEACNAMMEEMEQNRQNGEVPTVTRSRGGANRRR